MPPELRTRGAVLREAVSDLGPVFVKCGQTLAQRSDLVGSEVAKSLGKLQSSNRSDRRIPSFCKHSFSKGQQHANVSRQKGIASGK